MKTAFTYLSICLLLTSFTLTGYAQSKKALLNKAVEQGDNGRFDDAIVTLLKLSEKNPDNVEVNWYLGQYYYQVRFYSESIRFQENVAKLTNAAFAYANLAGVLGQQGYGEKGMRAIDKALALNSDYIGTYMNRGMIHAYYYRIEKALEDDYYVLENSPENEASAKYNIAVVHHALKEYDKSEKLLIDCLKLREESAETLLFLEEVRMLKDKNYKPSRELIERIKDLFSQKIKYNWYDHYAISERAKCYALLGQKDLARKDNLRALEIVNEILEDVPDAWRQVRFRGILYSRLGEKAKAIKDFEYVLTQSPNEASVIEKLAAERAK